MRVLDSHAHVVSVTDAGTSGLPKLLRDAEAGEDVVVERHGEPVAAVVSMRRLEEIRRIEVDLREARGRARVTGRSRESDRKPALDAGPAAAPVRGSGRHPDAGRVVVRSTDDAVADPERMVRKGDPQVARWALEKCLPAAGAGPRGRGRAARHSSASGSWPSASRTGAWCGGPPTTTKVAQSSTSRRSGRWDHAATGRCTRR